MGPVRGSSSAHQTASADWLGSGEGAAAWLGPGEGAADWLGRGEGVADWLGSGEGASASSARGLARDGAGVEGLGVTGLSLVGRGVGDPADSSLLPGAASSGEVRQPTQQATAAIKATRRSRQGALLSANITCKS